MIRHYYYIYSLHKPIEKSENGIRKKVGASEKKIVQESISFKLLESKQSTERELLLVVGLQSRKSSCSSITMKLIKNRIEGRIHR